MAGQTACMLIGPLDNATCFLLKELLRNDVSVVYLADNGEPDTAARLDRFFQRYERIYRRPLPRATLIPWSYDGFFSGPTAEQTAWLASHGRTIIYNSLKGPGPTWSDPISFWKNFIARNDLEATAESLHIITSPENLPNFQAESAKYFSKGKTTFYATGRVVGDSVFGHTFDSSWFHSVFRDGRNEEELVSGDWFATAMTSILATPRFWGHEWRLAANRRVARDEFMSAWHEVEPGLVQEESWETGVPSESAEISANVATILPKYPVPELNREILTTWIRGALENEEKSDRGTVSKRVDYTVEEQFGLAKGFEFSPWSAEGAVSFSEKQGCSNRESFRFGLRITGPGGGDWTAIVFDTTGLTEQDVYDAISCRVMRGLPEGDFPLLTLSQRTWARFRRSGAAPSLFDHAVWENGTREQGARVRSLLFPVFTIPGKAGP